MVMTDPLADMLTRIRNANMAYKEEVVVPSSRLKEEVARILVREGYVAEATVDGQAPHRVLRIRLKYGPNRERTITGIKRVSKPGRRVYADADHLPRVMGGLGVAILSTSRGVVTDRQARKLRVGGEVLAYVW
jgi:small subunit ribosomal protein S8